MALLGEQQLPILHSKALATSQTDRISKTLNDATQEIGGGDGGEGRGVKKRRWRSLSRAEDVFSDRGGEVTSLQATFFAAQM